MEDTVAAEWWCGAAVAVAAGAACWLVASQPSDDAAGAVAARLQANLPAGSPLLYRREWGGSSPAPQRGRRLRLLQFNTLADGLCGADIDGPLGGFDSVPPGALNWEYRKARLLEELMRHGELPDIIAMQEVDHFYDWFEPELEKLGYSGTFLKKRHSACLRTAPGSGLEDGAAIFLRRDAVEAIEPSEQMAYEKLAVDGTPTGQKANQVALLATVRLKGGGGKAPSEAFVVACTHLAAAKTAEGERTRAQQVAQLVGRLGLLGLPTIVALDMNAAPHDGGYVSEAYPAAVTLPLGDGQPPLRSAYGSALGQELAWTTWKRRGASEARHTIDYILVSEGLGVGRVLLPPDDAAMAPERLPGWAYPSDHIALFAELYVPGALANL